MNTIRTTVGLIGFLVFLLGIAVSLGQNNGERSANEAGMRVTSQVGEKNSGQTLVIGGAIITAAFLIGSAISERHSN